MIAFESHKALLEAGHAARSNAAPIPRWKDIRVTLSREQLDTLSNLMQKKAGGAVGWIAIAPARELTELGLAVRNRSGWEITADGEAALDQQGATNRSDPLATPIPFPGKDHGAKPR